MLTLLAGRAETRLKSIKQFISKLIQDKMSKTSAKRKEALGDNHIQREQLELVKTERDLQAMLDKINRQINQLVVEEFQLKSNQVSSMTETKYTGPEISAQPGGASIKVDVSTLQTHPPQPQFVGNHVPMDLNLDTLPAGFTIQELNDDPSNINQQHLDLDAGLPADFTIKTFGDAEEEEDDDY